MQNSQRTSSEAKTYHLWGWATSCDSLQSQHLICPCPAMAWHVVQASLITVLPDPSPTPLPCHLSFMMWFWPWPFGPCSFRPFLPTHLVKLWLRLRMYSVTHSQSPSPQKIMLAQFSQFNTCHCIKDGCFFEVVLLWLFRLFIEAVRRCNHNLRQSHQQIIFTANIYVFYKYVKFAQFIAFPRPAFPPNLLMWLLLIFSCVRRCCKLFQSSRSRMTCSNYRRVGSWLEDLNVKKLFESSFVLEIVHCVLFRSNEVLFKE